MAEARWLEVSMQVNGELAEAVSDVLNRFVSNGVVIESAIRFNDAEDEGTTYGPLHIYGYLAVDETLEERKMALETALWHLHCIQPLPEPSFRYIEDEDWMESWKQHYHPMKIGRRLLILPSWEPMKETEDIAVRIDPSMAFGTGTHPSTQLALELLESQITPGIPVIDVGCGSGILSIAAIKLGASKALAVDIDNAAIRSTKENATLNGVEIAIECGLGSVKEVLEGKFSFQEAPLVVVNILAPVILRLFEDGLSQMIQPAGKIVFAGILEEQGAAILQAAEKHGLSMIERKQYEDWLGLALMRD